MPSDDRDPKFERALAQHLRGGGAQANCPGTETLAAYHERNLSLEEMAQWKEHIAACEACQETLALVETTENQLAEDSKEQEIPLLERASVQAAHAGEMPKRSAKAAASGEPQAAASSVAILRRRPVLLRWAIPLGAAAAGVLVVIGLYEQRAPKVARDSDTIIARRQVPAAPTQVLDDKAGKVEPQLEPNEERAPAGATTRQKNEQELAIASPAAVAEHSKDAGDRDRGSRDQLVDGRLESKKSAPMPSPKPPPQAATGAAVSENAPVISGVPAPAPPPARADAKLAAPAAKQKQEVTVESQAAAVDTASNSMMMKQGAISESVEVNGANVGLILTPDNRVFWKLQPSGNLQLTTDGGKDWKSLETGANEYLTAGFAPSSRVCWFAGKSGTLLLTKDRGSHWTRISTPIAGDLGGVHAVDAKHASIWDANNHISYATSDGGATWKQTANE
jgi:hypothetical protein